MAQSGPDLARLRARCPGHGGAGPYPTSQPHGAPCLTPYPAEPLRFSGWDCSVTPFVRASKSSPPGRGARRAGRVRLDKRMDPKLHGGRLNPPRRPAPPLRGGDHPDARSYPIPFPTLHTPQLISVPGKSRPRPGSGSGTGMIGRSMEPSTETGLPVGRTVNAAIRGSSDVPVAEPHSLEASVVRPLQKDGLAALRALSYYYPHEVRHPAQVSSPKNPPLRPSVTSATSEIRWVAATGRAGSFVATLPPAAR